MKNLNTQLKQILNSIENNDNKDFVINRNYDTIIPFDKTESLKYKLTIDYLNNAFNEEGELIMETKINFNDDGGTGYEAYIVPGEYIQDYYDFLETEALSEKQKSYAITIMKFITLFEDKLITISANPY